MMDSEEARKIFDDINARLSNGWRCHAIAMLEGHGGVRLQLGDDGFFSDAGFRAGVEASTIEKAIEKAAAWTAQVTPAEHFQD